MFDKQKFREAVARKGYTLADLAKVLKIDQATLYRKINGDSDFYRREIQVLCKTLDIKNPVEIFFAEKFA